MYVQYRYIEPLKSAYRYISRVHCACYMCLQRSTVEAVYISWKSRIILSSLSRRRFLKRSFVQLLSRSNGLALIMLEPNKHSCLLLENKNRWVGMLRLDVVALSSEQMRAGASSKIGRDLRTRLNPQTPETWFLKLPRLNSPVYLSLSYIWLPKSWICQFAERLSPKCKSVCFLWSSSPIPAY